MLWSDWANLLLRWLHLFAGILWIGQTLALHVDGPPASRTRSRTPAASSTWSTAAASTSSRSGPASRRCRRRSTGSSGRRRSPGRAGIALLVVVYYMGGLLQEPDAELSQTAAIAIGLALLPGWLDLYDTLWRFVPARVATPISFAAHRRPRLGARPRVLGARRLHARRRGARHDHGGQRLAADHSRPARDGRGDPRRPRRPTSRSARAPRSARSTTRSSWCRS